MNENEYVNGMEAYQLYPVVQVNEIVLLSRGSSYVKHVVYKIERDRWHRYIYHLINLEDKVFDSTKKISPASENHGSGFYYSDKKPYYLEEHEVALLIEAASGNQTVSLKEEEQELSANELKLKKGTERLKEIVPEGAQGIIVAKLYVREEMVGEDYPHYVVARTVILGFSDSARTNFTELRRMAGNFKDTQFLAEPNEEYEHRETGNYFLGENAIGGWHVLKNKIHSYKYLISNYALIAGDESNIYISPALSRITETSSEMHTQTDFSSLNLELVDYSEKSIALFGDTKEISEFLNLTLRGRFNKYLNYEGGKKAGWIFPKKKEAEVREKLNLKK